MTLSENPDLMRRVIVERLVGATGDPRHVIEATRGCAMRALPQVMEAFHEKFPSPIGIDIADIDICRLADLKPEEGSHDALAVVPSVASRDALTMRLEPKAISLLVSSLFGGNPDIPPPPINRPPSVIELDVVAMAFEIFAKALNGFGPRALGLRLPLQPLLSGNDFRRFIVRDGPGVRMTFSIGGEKEGGTLTAWMPQRVILETRDIASGNTVIDEAQAEDWRSRFGDEVMRSGVDLRATIPLMKTALGDLAKLQQGEIIEFRDGAQSEARLSVRGRTVFLCDFGKAGNNYTVRIKQPFDARQDVIEGLLGD